MVKRVVAPWLVLRVAKRLSRSVPFAGAVLAVAVTGQSVKRKGWLRGVLHTGLDAIPVLGAVKGAVEVFTGDLIPDRMASAAARSTRVERPWSAEDGRPAPTVDEATLAEPPRFLRRVQRRSRTWARPRVARRSRG